MKFRLSVATAVIWFGGLALADPVTFANDYAGFQAAAGSLSIIDFEALPDGTPSAGHAGTPITSSFNYDLQGAHFSSPLDTPYIAGNTILGFSLDVFRLSSTDRTWIIADLTSPAHAVGAFFPGVTQLCAFDAGGAPLACVEYFHSGSGNSVGIVSNTPIARAIFNDGSSSESIESFVF